MTTTLEIDYPPALLMRGGELPAIQQRSRFLLALKYFELGELTSGQAATLCGLGRVAFLAEAARCGVPAVDLGGDDLNADFFTGPAHHHSRATP